MKALIVYDNGVSLEHFKAAFDKMSNNFEIRMIPIDRNIIHQPITVSDKRIKEYIGKPEQLEREIGDVEILVVNYAPVTAEVMDADRNLKIIGVTRGGPVNIDMEAATQRGIFVVNAPERNIEAVADFTIGLMIAEARNIARAYHLLKTGKVLKVNPRLFGESETMGVEIAGKTLGIIGLGKIGRKVISRAKGFNMQILAFDPYVNVQDAEVLGVKLICLEDLLKKSDFVTIHVRSTKETWHMIGEKELSLMKKNAYLINTSRGNIVDENALYTTLESNKIAGAALDVVENEPINPDNPLLGLDNVTVTPHMAGMSEEVPLKSALIIAEEINKFVNGERLERLVNKKVTNTKLP